MFWTVMFEYDGRIVVVILIDVYIGRLLRGVYVIVPASVAVIIIIVAVFIIFSGDVVLVSLVIVWLGVRDFMLQSIEEFQSDGGFPCDPPESFSIPGWDNLPSGRYLGSI